MTTDDARQIVATSKARQGQMTGPETLRYFAARLVLADAGIETMTPSQRDFAIRSRRGLPNPTGDTE